MKKTLTEIEAEFRANIKIPETKPSRQFFLCPVGLVGSGKTTVLKPIVEKFNLVRISSDEVRKSLLENGYDYGPVKEIVFKVINELARLGYSLALDMDCGNPLTKEHTEKLLSELNAKIFYVHINPPQEYVFEKFRNFPLELSWLAPGRPDDMINNYLVQKEKRKEENTHFDFIYTFDTSRADIADQIGECCKKIQEEIGK
jgi:predicted kinase